MEEIPALRSSPHELVEACLSVAASRRWRWLTLEGSCLILLGIAALLMAPSADSTLNGAILLGACALTLVSLLQSERHPAFGLSLLLALAGFGAGLHLLGDPPKTELGLAFAAYFSLRGITMILLATALRRQRFKEWEWSTVSGVTSLILAGLLLSGLPGPYVWMLGLLLGVDLIFDGTALLALVLAANRVRDTVRAPALPSGPVCEEAVRT
jgi:uncharacterized membrane protein HdeD (DUF308 family)